jgi:hypothetical protein
MQESKQVAANVLIEGVPLESIDINQALPKLPELLEMAFAGEEIMITKNNQQQI